MKSKTIHFPVFHYKIRVYVAEDIVAKYNSVFKVEYEADNSFINGLHDCKDDCSYVFVKPSVGVGIVTHESYHAIKAMFRWVNIETEDEEEMAYHLEYTVEKITDFLNKLKNG